MILKIKHVVQAVTYLFKKSPSFEIAYMNHEVQEMIAILENMRKFRPRHTSKLARGARWKDAQTIEFPRGRVEIQPDSGTHIWRFSNGAHVVESIAGDPSVRVTLGQGTRVTIPPRAFEHRMVGAVCRGLRDAAQGKGDRHPGGMIVVKADGGLTISVIPIGSKQLRIDVVGEGPKPTEPPTRSGCWAWLGWGALIVIALLFSAGIIAGVVWLITSRG